MHKNHPLVKPMIIVTSTGYIVDVFGPYFAVGKNNDTNILNNLLVMIVIVLYDANTKILL